MPRQIMLPPTESGGDRRQPLLNSSERGSSGRKKLTLAEVAGGTTAECAAVACCCPCGIAKLVVLAVYKLPAGLCRKALRKQRLRRLMRKGELLPSKQCCCDQSEVHLHPVTTPIAMVTALDAVSEDTEVVELEKEMWDKFYGTGFWRSPSQRSETA